MFLFKAFHQHILQNFLLSKPTISENIGNFQFCNFAVRFSVYIVWPFEVSLNNLKALQNISSEKHFNTRKLYIYI